MERLLDEAARRGETWTAPQLADWLAQAHQVALTPAYLATRLRQRRLRWKRTKRSVRHKQRQHKDPTLQDRKVADLETLISAP